MSSTEPSRTHQLVEALRAPSFQQDSEWHDPKAAYATKPRALLDEAADKIEGLECDLDEAVRVAFRRGAAEWTRLNYPRNYERLTVGHCPTRLAAIGAANTEGNEMTNSIQAQIDEMPKPEDYFVGHPGTSWAGALALPIATEEDLSAAHLWTVNEGDGSQWELRRSRRGWVRVLVVGS